MTGPDADFCCTDESLCVPDCYCELSVDDTCVVM